MVKVLVFLYKILLANEIAIQECEGIVRQTKIMVSFSQNVNTCRFRLQETVQNMWMIGAYLREQIIVRLYTMNSQNMFLHEANKVLISFNSYLLIILGNFVQIDQTVQEL